MSQPIELSEHMEALCVSLAAARQNGSTVDAPEFEFSLCPRHAKQRRLKLSLSALLIVASMAFPFLVDVDWGGIAAAVGVLFGIGLFARQWNVLSATHLDVIQARIRVGEPFAASFASEL